ncbi:MAG: beta-ketoacyl-ACP synthase III [Beijerinckiaceae bacterium]
MSAIRSVPDSAPAAQAVNRLRGIGVFVPDDRISNDELATTFNKSVTFENQKRIALGYPMLEPSSADFILEASGIRNRHVLDKSGILDPVRMVPNLPERLDDALSIQAEFAVKSAHLALADAGLEPSDIDLVICACAHHQRPYPAIAIEIQKALGCRGAAFDMNVACSSATFAMHLATQMVNAGGATNVLVCSPEIMSGHLNHRDRKTHFIFGDASTSVIIGRSDGKPVRSGAPQYEIRKSDIWTEFSSNIRSNFGFLNRTSPTTVNSDDKLVTQVGSKVFKDIVFAASRHIRNFVSGAGLEIEQLERLWLHQANLKLLRSLVKHIANDELMARVPIVLDEIGNVASPGSLIAFDRTRGEVPIGGHGILCSFGAGYSIGCLLLKRVS